MARREETTRLLSGRNSANPLEMSADFALQPRVPRNVPGMRQAAGVQISATQGVLGELAQWGSKKIREAAKTRYEAEAMDGAMAYQQGVAAETLDPGMNGWKLEGFRVMDAATSASALLAAQQQEIAMGANALDPDAYRSALVGRFESVLAGKDERTQDLIRSQMMEQMPSLVATHTAANLEYREQQSYDSLVNTMSVVSGDPASSGKLLAFARGETGSTGLSEERRQSAVVDGIIRSYELDNPAAYSILAADGVLAELPAADLARLRSSQAAFEARRKSEYDPAFFEQEQALNKRVENGEFLNPLDAVAAYSDLYTARGVTLNAAEAEGVLGDAEEAGASHARATVYGIETARISGDYNKIAELTGPYIVHIESRGNRNAVSPTGAKSEWQVMDGTNADPGFGVRAAQDDTLAERARVGRDYWAAMVRRYNGDLEAAGIAYNAGPGNADAFLAGGRSYDSIGSAPAREQARDYVQKLMRLVGGEQYVNAADRAGTAQATFEEARDRLAVDNYNIAAPILRALDRQLATGQIDVNQYDQQYQEVSAQHGLAMTKADVDYRVRQVDTRINAITDAATKAAEDAAKIAKTDAEKAAAEAAREQAANSKAAFAEQKVLRDAQLSEAQELVLGQKFDPNQQSQAEFFQEQQQQLAAVAKEYRAGVAADAASLGIPYAEAGGADTASKVVEATTAALKRAHEKAKDRAMIEAATSNGTLGTLTPAQQQTAWESHKQSTMTNVQTEVARRRITPEAGQQAIEAANQRFYARTGVVPAEVRNVASASLNGEVLNDKGELNPQSLATIQEYNAIRNTSTQAANQYLDPAAKAVADAVLSISGGNPGLMPSALKQVWAEGLNTKFNKSGADPKFLERPDVVAALDDAVGTAIFETAKTFFNQDRNLAGVYTGPSVYMKPDAQAAVKEMIAAKTLEMHKYNPRVDPRHLVRQATDVVTSSMAVIQGDVVMDPFGGDLYPAVFGAQADQFRNDPSAIGSALDTYITSPEFLAANPELRPNFGLFTGAGELGRMAASGVPGIGAALNTGPSPVVAGALTGRPVYEVTMIGGNKMLVSFTVNDEGAVLEKVIDLKDVGAARKAADRTKLTK